MKITLTHEEIAEILAEHLQGEMDMEFELSTAELEEDEEGVTFTIDAVPPEWEYEDGDDSPGEPIPILKVANG